jgi:hypothetical protein
MTILYRVHPDNPAGYEHVTLRQLRELYTGPGALPCPPELLAWLDHAIQLHDIVLREQALREALQ